MTPFASRLRQRAQELGISHSEVARRAGLSERRYAHYIVARSEPNFPTLLRIAKVLGTTPNWLLGVEAAGAADPSETARLADRLTAAANAMPTRALELLVIQAEAVARSVKE